MYVLITGARGFIGKHLWKRLKTAENVILLASCKEDNQATLESSLSLADVIYHLAGVNRPDSVDEYERTNVGVTKQICSILDKLNRKPMIVLTSSIQAEFDNPYGVSKKRAEDVLLDFAKRNNSIVRIYRLKNVFGPGCKPNYNSVVATFCYNITNNIPVWLSDPNHEVDLVYIDDVIDAITLDDGREIPSVKITLSELNSRILSFRGTHIIPKDNFHLKLYRTYLSYSTRLQLPGTEVKR